MRARNIKPAFFKNEHLALLSPHARMLFIGLWCLADRRGRLEDRPMKIKAELFPFESVEIAVLLEELDHSPGDLITRYEASGKALIQVENFHKHQHPHHKEPESILPICLGHPLKEPDSKDLEETLDKPQTSLGQTQGKHLLGQVSARLIPDSLNLIPDTLSMDPDSGGEGFIKIGKEGQAYLNRLDATLFENVAWVPGYLSLQCEELSQTRPDLKVDDVLACWKAACEVSASKKNGNPNYLKAVFQGKLKAWQPGEGVHNPVPVQEDLSAQGRALLSHEYVFDVRDPECPIPTQHMRLDPSQPRKMFKGSASWDISLLQPVINTALSTTEEI